MYHFHTTAQHVNIPIIQLEDAHLLNILKLHSSFSSLTNLQKKFVSSRTRSDPSDILDNYISHFFEGLRRDSTREETQDILKTMFPDVERAKQTTVFDVNNIKALENNEEKYPF